MLHSITAPCSEIELQRKALTHAAQATFGLCSLLRSVVLTACIPAIRRCRYIMSIKLNQVGVMLCNADDLRNVQEPLFVECFTGADLWVECMGPDHCPVWADLDMLIPQLPQDFLPPALSTRHTFAGMSQQ